MLDDSRMPVTPRVVKPRGNDWRHVRGWRFACTIRLLVAFLLDSQNDPFANNHFSSTLNSPPLISLKQSGRMSRFSIPDKTKANRIVSTAKRHRTVAQPRSSRDGSNGEQLALVSSYLFSRCARLVLESSTKPRRIFLNGANRPGERVLGSLQLR